MMSSNNTSMYFAIHATEVKGAVVMGLQWANLIQQSDKRGTFCPRIAWKSLLINKQLLRQQTVCRGQVTFQKPSENVTELLPVEKEVARRTGAGTKWCSWRTERPITVLYALNRRSQVIKTYSFSLIMPYSWGSQAFQLQREHFHNSQFSPLISRSSSSAFTC